MDGAPNPAAKTWRASMEMLLLVGVARLRPHPAQAAAGLNCSPSAERRHRSQGVYQIPRPLHRHRRSTPSVEQASLSRKYCHPRSLGKMAEITTI
jgi:hypothetical protein